VDCLGARDLSTTVRTLVFKSGQSFSVVDKSVALQEEKKGLLVKALLDHTPYEAGLMFELDKHYKNSATVAAAVHRIWNQVKNNPEKYAVSNDLIDAVATKMKNNRKSMIGGDRKTLRELRDEKLNMPIDKLAIDNRAKAAVALGLRLDEILFSKKNRDKISIGELAKVYGITFDKGQIVEGKATDHVSLMAKISKDMTPSEAIDVILKMREYNQAVSEQAKK
jgi:hypothetical protein